LTSAASAASHNVLLFPYNAWAISYRYNDTYFDISIDCQTGEIKNTGRSTAKEMFPLIKTLATEFAPDAK
ncbi:MAG: hypothetical protein ACP5E3_18395, partial [Bacteroidales bacterium]